MCIILVGLAAPLIAKWCAERLPRQLHREDALTAFLTRMWREQGWLSSRANRSHTLKRASASRGRLLLPPPLPVRRRAFIGPNCASLSGAESPECQTMKIHQVVIVIRCERGGGGGD